MHQASLKSWSSLSLTKQFLLAGGAVMLVGTYVVGSLVASFITTSVTRNAAAATALYVDSIIAPLLPDMQRGEILTDGVAAALDETLANGALGGRVFAFKLWDRNGVILYSKDHSEIGRKVLPSQQLKDAWTGKVVAQFGAFGENEQKEAASGLPLLEIYNPILQPWSGEVVAVSEFYEVAANLESDLRAARLTAGMAVAGIAISFFVSLFAIVRKGSLTIDAQRSKLKERVDQLTSLLSANDALRLRVQGASQRTAALNESHLRSIGADLHDGPAQLVALAALRLDAEDLAGDRTSPHARKRALQAVRAVLSDAMLEIRTISGGLVLPQVDNAPIDQVIVRAIRAHEQRTDTKVELDGPAKCVCTLPASAKICAYRFVQEGLNNAYKHAEGNGQRVRLRCTASRMLIEVIDRGNGMAATPDPARLGLNGLRDRVESIGGYFRMVSSSKGTRLSMVLSRNFGEP
jgi:signal transduction histidine kinase